MSITGQQATKQEVEEFLSQREHASALVYSALKEVYNASDVGDQAKVLLSEYFDFIEGNHEIEDIVEIAKDIADYALDQNRRTSEELIGKFLCVATLYIQTGDLPGAVEALATSLSWSAIKNNFELSAHAALGLVKNDVIEASARFSILEYMREVADLIEGADNELRPLSEESNI